MIEGGRRLAAILSAGVLATSCSSGGHVPEQSRSMTPISTRTSGEQVSPSSETGLATLPKAEGGSYPLTSKQNALVDDGLRTTPQLQDMGFVYVPQGSVLQMGVFFNPNQLPKTRRVVSYEEVSQAGLPPAYLVDDKTFTEKNPIYEIIKPVIDLQPKDKEIVIYGVGKTQKEASIKMRTYEIWPKTANGHITGLDGRFIGYTTLPQKLVIRKQ